MLTTSNIARVMALYDLGKIHSVTQARRGFVNETVFIRTERGQFVIRRSHRRLGEASLRYQHSLILWLSQHNFPVPALISARNNDTLCEIDGRFYEVRSFIEGGDFDAHRPLQAIYVGETLAQYHHLIQGFPPLSDTIQPRYSPQTILGLTERLLERDVMGEIYDWLIWYDRRAAQLRRTLPVSGYDGLPHVVIHGDIHSDNLLFSNDQVVALLDYDQATWDARIVDIADGLIGFATAHINSEQLQWGVYQGPIDEERAARLISGYARVAPLSHAEITALPQLVEIIWLQGELGRVISTPEGSPEYHQDVLNQGRWLSTWMQERSQYFVMQWTNLNVQMAQRNHHPIAA